MGRRLARTDPTRLHLKPTGVPGYGSFVRRSLIDRVEEEAYCSFEQYQMKSSPMDPLTARQQAVLDFIRAVSDQGGVPPTLREIAAHFGFRSMNAAADHVRALRRKGVLSGRARRARAIQVRSSLERWRRRVAEIPLLGSIPAGFARDMGQEAAGCVSIDVGTLGFRPTSRTFALEVRGDSMEGKHIVEGDVVILEHGLEARSGDVVAALIDNESTLKTFVRQRGRSYLRSENPAYPDLIPATELVIQGVMVGLVRRRRLEREKRVG
jgi:repressor LexA